MFGSPAVLHWYPYRVPMNPYGTRVPGYGTGTAINNNIPINVYAVLGLGSILEWPVSRLMPTQRVCNFGVDVSNEKA